MMLMACIFTMNARCLLCLYIFSLVLFFSSEMIIYVMALCEKTNKPKARHILPFQSIMRGNTSQKNTIYRPYQLGTSGVAFEILLSRDRLQYQTKRGSEAIQPMYERGDQLQISSNICMRLRLYAYHVFSALG